MSAGLPSVHFHAQPELHVSRVGRDAARDSSGRPASAPFWTVPHGPSVDRPSEMESMYARPPHLGGGSVEHHVSAGIASPPFVVRPPQHNEMRSASVQLPVRATAAVAAVPFSGPTGVRQFDCSGPGLSPFRVGPDARGNPQGLGNADAPSQDIAGAPASGFTPANQTWEEMGGIGFAPRAHPLLPPPVRSWEPSEPTRIQPPSLVGNDTSSVEPALPQNAENDDDVYTFLCEWTDEHGMCNMVIFGDRVWMSHHLSRRHNVVGHEKSQRACLWRGCTDTMNKGSLARHVVSRHLRAGASCGFCSKVYSRTDVARRHTKKCKVANGASMQRDQTKW